MFKFNLKNLIWAIAGLVLLTVAVFFIVNWLVNSKNSTSSENA
jgi:flagellar basal body-associated protein FliL